MIPRLLVLGILVAAVATPRDRRIVDRVVLGDPHSERDHACAVAPGWTRCGLAVFDDTEVTVSVTVAGSAEPRTFDLFVENTPVATYTSNSRDSASVEFRVPLAVTTGHTNIFVLLRASNGLMPSLLTLRSIQDHNE